MRRAVDLAQRLQKRDGQTHANRDRLEAMIREMVADLRRSTLHNRLHRLDALEKGSEEIEKVHDLGGSPTRPRLQDIFYLLPLARQRR